MPAADTAAIICDTGALLDYLVAGATDHHLFKRAIDRSRTRYVPGLVLAELDYFLRDERVAMRRFVQDLRRGAFTYAPPAIDQILRAMQIDERHPALGLGLVDASIVALADDLGVTRIATRDVRHFTAVRLTNGRPFEFVVHPTNPDRS